MYQSSDDTQKCFDVVTFLFSMNLCRGQNERKLCLNGHFKNLYAKQEFQHITKQVKEEMGLKERFIHSF